MRRLIAAVAPLLFPSALASAQQDSTRSLNRVVVTAERAATILTTSAAAVTRISASELARVPSATVADVLRLVPGIAIADFDGTGRDPQLMTRGFYGGGEAEYAVVLVDGQPVNGAHNGVIPWHALPPLASIDAVEIVRGAVSALYGDAAVGAVINILTRRAARGIESWHSAGSFGTIRNTATFAWPVLSVAAALDHDGGYRDHARQMASRARLRTTGVPEASTRQALALTASWRDSDEPGPLLESLARQDRRASDALFRFDRTRDLGAGVSLDRQSVLRWAVLTASGSADYRDLETIRTIALAPGVGDTKARELSHWRFGGAAQVDFGPSPLPGASRLTAGVEAGYAAISSTWYELATGDREAYAAADGERGNADAAGNASRMSAALFAHYAVEPATAVRLSLAVRGDLLRDRFDPRAPSSGTGVSATHAALSPKMGVSFAYLRGVEATGHLYLTAGTTFKAPTLDQLFDQRSIPIPFPPFRATTSNQSLSPQRGTHVEAGLYHNLLTRGTILTGTLSGYQTVMRDELDFDVATLRYVNIGRSRHRGVEAGLTISMPFTAPAFVTYARQTVTSRRGAYAGRLLKAIPRDLLNLGFPVGIGSTLDPRVIVSHTGAAFFDDANTRRIPSYTRVDMQWMPPFRGSRLVLEVRNLLDAEYSSTGYLDPAGSGEAYLYPAAGRTLQVGIRRIW